MGIALITYVLFGNSFLFNKAMQTLEYSNESNVLNQKYQCGLLLGGYGRYGEQIDGMELGEAADRLQQTLKLYKSGHISKIVILSGASSEEHPEKKESEMTKDFLKNCGIPISDILIEDNSLNTFENAFEANILLKKQGLKGPHLLITSAFHMRRAKACFDSQGIDSQPFPCDYYSVNHNFSLKNHFFPTYKTLLNWPIIIKEIIGYWVYDIKGYIN